MEDGTRAGMLATQATRLASFWRAKHESTVDESVGLSLSVVSYAAVVTQRLCDETKNGRVAGDTASSLDSALAAYEPFAICFASKQCPLLYLTIYTM